MTERFTLLDELGRGGMGVVWKARDEETGQIVALKLLREAYAEDPEYLARFERELELARRIDSVHVVKVLGFGVREKLPYLALEYVDGPSLHTALVQHGPYSWPETRALLIQLTQGLADANAAGVIHRDVKPSNVLLGPDGIAKLTDFGIARGIDTTRMTATSTMLGTPAYLAPEGPKDARSDLYSLGIIGYELLTGVVPFRGTSYQDVIVEHIRTAPDLAKVPPEARPTIAWLLAKDPAQRPQRASALLPILYGVEPVPAVEMPVAQTSVIAPSPVVVAAPPPQPVPAQWTPPPLPAYAPGPPVYPPAPGGQGWAPSRPPVGHHRRAMPLIAILVCLGLVVCVLVAALTTGVLSPRSDGRPGTFTPTGSMTNAREYHSASLLRNGQVLIAEGDASGTAELYDPGTGRFSPAGSTTAAREFFSTSLLRDGRVLIVGGYRCKNGGCSDSLSSAELYDPNTGKFSPTGSMTTGRSYQTATVLIDGRVLIAGGDTSGTAELYDPSTGTFSPTGSMTTGRDEASATLLTDGDVLIAGGNGNGSGISSAELYDPQTGKFSATGSMATGRMGLSATRLADGRVLIVGGYNCNTSGSECFGFSSAELYDPQTGKFSTTGSMATERPGPTSTLLSDGRVLVLGGNAILASAETYDPNSGRFSPAGSMTTAREGHSATLLANGRVLIAGGYSCNTSCSAPTSLASAELYTP